MSKTTLTTSQDSPISDGLPSEHTQKPKRRVRFLEFLVALFIIASAWVAKDIFGIALFGSDALDVTDPDSVIQVMFTSPRYPDIDDYHVGGFDERLSQAIAQAEQSVDIAAFEFDLPLVAEALVAAQSRGVTVRIVTDSDYRDEHGIAILLAGDIPIVFDERSALMHNKFVIIDGFEVWTGSWNLTGNGTYRNNNNVVILRSAELAANYVLEFEEMYVEQQFGIQSPDTIAFPEIDLEGVKLVTVFEAEGEASEEVIKLIQEAETHIYFMAFVFTDDAIADALVIAARSGVDVEGIIESRSMNLMGSEAEKLAEAGIDVLHDGNPYVMHHKVIIIDGEIVVTGSYNFSNNAAKVNDENVLIIHSPEVAKAYALEYQYLARQARDPQRMALINSLVFPMSSEDF